MFKVILITTGQVQFSSQDEKQARKWLRQNGERFSRLYGPDGLLHG